jgi:hypothetical protein
MKLECVGKLPFGTYAEMEREGISLNEIDTTDCDNSLESLQVPVLTATCYIRVSPQLSTSNIKTVISVFNTSISRQIVWFQPSNT